MKALLKIIIFSAILLITQNVFSQDSLQIHENHFPVYNFGLFQNYTDINSMSYQMNRIIPLCDVNNNSIQRPHPIIRAIGGIFITAGIGAIITSPFVFTFGNNDPDNFNFNNPAVVKSVSLFGGGILSLMTGSLISGSHKR
jgi:hypothetical protein